jgi:hypothetical protein
MARGESLDMLTDLYGDLRSSGARSLSAAYKFGQVVRALHRAYSFTDMAEYLGISVATVSKYAKLAGLYSTEVVLLRTAEQMSSWDISKLISIDAGVPIRSVLECRNCHSHDIAHKRERVTVPDTPAELLRQS